MLLRPEPCDLARFPKSQACTAHASDTSRSLTLKVSAAPGQDQKETCTQNTSCEAPESEASTALSLQDGKKTRRTSIKKMFSKMFTRSPSRSEVLLHHEQDFFWILSCPAWNPPLPLCLSSPSQLSPLLLSIAVSVSCFLPLCFTPSVSSDCLCLLCVSKFPSVDACLGSRQLLV